MNSVTSIISYNELSSFIKLPSDFQNAKLKVRITPVKKSNNKKQRGFLKIQNLLTKKTRSTPITDSLAGILEGSTIALEEARSERLLKNY